MTQFEFVERATATIASNRRASMVRRELLSHLDMKQTELIENGIDVVDAEKLALESMGDPAIIADQYYLPRTSLKLGTLILAGIPLLGSAILALQSPPDVLIWMIVVATIAVIAEPGASLTVRFHGLGQTLNASRLLVGVSALEGLAQVIIMLSGIGSPTGPLLVIVEFIISWLIVLYLCWQRQPGSRWTPGALAWMASLPFLAIGGSAFWLSHWNSAFLVWWEQLRSFTMMGMSLAASVFVLAHLWEVIQALKARDVHASAKRATRLSSAPQQD